MQTKCSWFYPAALLLAHCVMINAQSGVHVSAVMNSASYAIAGPESSGIAQGSLFVVFGSNLGPNELQQARSFPLLPQLAGSSVHLNIQGTTVNAILIYTSSKQLAALLPSRTPRGNGTLTVTYNGVISNEVPIKVVESSFGIYTLSQTGRGPGVLTDPVYHINAPNFAANPGETMTIWGTGLGPVQGDDAAGPLPGNLTSGAQVFVGTAAAKVRYAGRSGCCAGLDQIAFDVPAGVTGCFVPVAVQAGGIVSNFAAVSIAAQGRQCVDSAGVPVAAWQKVTSGSALRIGAIGLASLDLARAIQYLLNPQRSAGGLSTSAHISSAGQPGNPANPAPTKQVRGRVRKAIKAYNQKHSKALAAQRAAFTTKAVQRILEGSSESRMSGGFANLRNLSSLLPHLISTISAPGSCSVLACATGDCGLAGAFPSDPEARIGGVGLDAGPELTLTGPFGLIALPKVNVWEYRSAFASPASSGQPPAGDYTVTGRGGTDVGPFTAHLTVGAPMGWTNKDSVGPVDRTQGLTINWSAGTPNGYAIIGGMSSSHFSRSTAIFICSARSNSRSFTVPAFVLSALPADTPEQTGNPAPGYLFLGVHPLSNTFSAQGIDLGYFSDFSLDVKELQYQ